MSRVDGLRMDQIDYWNA